MRDIEHKILCKQHAELKSRHPELLGFEDLEAFIAEYEATWNGCSRINFGARNVCYRKDTEGLFEEGNTVWLAVEHDAQEEMPTYPAIGGNKA